MKTLLSILGYPSSTALRCYGDLIFDYILGITWQKNANLAATETFGVNDIFDDGRMSWHTAKEWIAAMNDVNYLGYDDWRLPVFIDSDSWKVIGKNWGYHKGWGYNCNDSELGWMYYLTMEAKFKNPISSGRRTDNLALFDNLQDYGYWLGNAESQKRAHCFNNENGFLAHEDKYDYNKVWVVRNGFDDPLLWSD